MKKLSLGRITLVTEVEVVEMVTREFNGKKNRKALIAGFEAEIDDSNKPTLAPATVELKSEVELLPGKNKVIVSPYAYTDKNTGRATYGLKIIKSVK